ncbi:MAG TPA: hypothetical protein VHC22_21175 [Pirellulales bacterium]|nr:hypothetical protein [Pirellulales bacterium]
MTPRLRILLGLSLVAIHISLPLAAFACVRWQPQDWSTRSLFRVVVFSEVGVLCVWAALSARRPVWKAAICAAGLALSWSLLKVVDAKQTSRLLVECLLFPGAATFALTLAIRSSAASGAADSGWQFSVGQLLVFTTAIAVVIALIQHFWEGRLFFNPQPRLVLAEGAQIAVILMTWAVLPRRRRKLRLTVATLLVGAVGVTVQSFMSDSFFWDAVKALHRISPFTLWEDLLSIPLVMLLESLFAAATVALLYRTPAEPPLSP